MIFYELLYGTVPWNAPSEKDLARLMIQTPLQFSPDIPVSEEAKNFIRECLTVDEDCRINLKGIEVIKIMKWLDALCVLFWSVTGSFISSVTLIYYVNKEGNLDNVFTMIYLFSLLTNPLNSLPWTVGGML